MMKVRCSKCHRNLEPDTLICPYCKTRITAAASDRYDDVLKPRSRISIKGAGSRMSGQSTVDAVRHQISSSPEYDSLEKIRCITCGTVNDKDARYCRKCRAKIS